MHSLPFYLQLGFDHISDLAGYDHMLFLVALCAVYRLEQWKQLVILVTAFTVGHSITLGLTSLSLLTIPSDLIEFLIPVTISITALHNVSSHRQPIQSEKLTGRYLMALIFGFIHGMGFSNYFRALLMDESSILVPLVWVQSRHRARATTGCVFYRRHRIYISEPLWYAPSRLERLYLWWSV